MMELDLYDMQCPGDHMSLESLISCRIANRTRFCGEKFCAGGFVSEASEVDAFVVLMRLYS